MLVPICVEGISLGMLTCHAEQLAEFGYGASS